MNNIWSNPEKYGLQIVGEAEFSSGCYEFDTTVLWRSTQTGDFYIADDAGCSCPMPFESTGMNDLTKIEKLQDLIDYLETRKKESYRYDPDSEYMQDSVAAIDAECGELIQKYRQVA